MYKFSYVIIYCDHIHKHKPAMVYSASHIQFTKEYVAN